MVWNVFFNYILCNLLEKVLLNWLGISWGHSGEEEETCWDEKNNYIVEVVSLKSWFRKKSSKLKLFIKTNFFYISSC